MSDLVSAVALIVSLCVLWYTIRHNRKMASHQYWSSSEAIYVQLEQALNKSPNILRFHGIDEDIEKKYGITIDELSYLLPIFTAGGIYDRTVGNNVKANKPFELDGYYGQLLSSKHTRKLGCWAQTTGLPVPKGAGLISTSGTNRPFTRPPTSRNWKSKRLSVNFLP